MLTDADLVLILATERNPPDGKPARVKVLGPRGSAEPSRLCDRLADAWTAPRGRALGWMERGGYFRCGGTSGRMGGWVLTLVPFGHLGIPPLAGSLAFDPTPLACPRTNDRAPGGAKDGGDTEGAQNGSCFAAERTGTIGKD